MSVYCSAVVCSAATVLGITIFPTLALAQSPHRACNTADPPLARGETDVIPGDPKFVKSNGSVYEVSIFGLGKANPDVKEKPYDICLRYEFENRSGENIQEFRWRDAGVGHIQYLEPGMRFRIPGNITSEVQTVTTSATDLHAFENIAATSRTVFAVQGTAAKPAKGLRFGSMESNQKVVAAGAATEPVLAIALPSEERKFPPLIKGLESSKITISIQSTATVFPKDRFAQIVAEITFVSQMEGAVNVYAPTLSTLASANFTSEGSLDDRIAAFLEFLPKSSEPLKMSDSAYKHSVGVRTPEAGGGDTPALFVAEHPVTVTVGEWSACLIAQTYSPVPVTLTDAHCRAPNP
ncbi:hypothetical protein [Sinorhizobium fredii]|uniref:hypothetical protein n=1 Tax=Rhizobium fredii TaxID=380 RepID=UPI000565AFEC|nr:hypothetical protein [Sinorhizobium fredii]